ncbi:MAG: GldG family protein [Chloroflexi bacterium]|nr:GldG family protein [Chloroflexota bacterium]
MSDPTPPARRRRAAPEARRRFALTPDTFKVPLAVVGALLILAGGSYYIILGGFDTTARVITAAGILLLGVSVAIDPEALWGKLTTRNMLLGGNTLLIAAIFIGILVFVNILGARRPQRWDLTAAKSLSLSEETVQVVSNLPQPVQAIVFADAMDSRKSEIENQLYEMQVRSNGMLTYEVIDPRDAPQVAGQLGVRELGTTVLVMGDRRQQVTGTREADFTTGLIKLVRPNPRKAYITTGHQERRFEGFDQDSYGQLKQQFESRNFTVESLSLFTTPEVPQDANLVVIAGPRTPFNDAEIQALSAYIDRGGDMLVMVDPATDSGLAPLLAKWGIEAGRQYVAEGDQRLTARSPFLPVVADLASHPVTDKLRSMGLFYLFAVPTYLTVPQQPPAGWRITPIARTSPQSWAESDDTAIRNPGNAKFDEGVEQQGPFNLAVVVEQAAAPTAPGAPPTPDTGEPKSRVMIVSTSQLGSNSVLGFGAQLGNADLVLNAASWLVGDDDLVSIRPREPDDRTLFLTQAQKMFVMLSSIVLVPALVLSVGVLVWWKRR